MAEDKCVNSTLPSKQSESKSEESPEKSGTLVLLKTFDGPITPVLEKKDKEGPIWKLGDKDNFSAAVMKLMLNRDGTPVIVSEHSGRFTMVMATFQHYEKAGNCDGSHGNLLKWIVKFLKESDDVFEKDFPFYIILAYRIKLYAFKSF
eukprot:Em0014g315a